MGFGRKRTRIINMIVFSKEWFEKHQRKFLWLLNSRLTKRWFRWVLRIRHCDCPVDVKITAIAPNHFSYGDRYFRKGRKWFVERTTDFRTHPKFAKRLYYAFKPLWWTLHAWDWLVADRFAPRLSFGFLTLTVFPDPSTGATTVDGYVRNSQTNVTWATLHDAADGTTTVSTNANDDIVDIIHGTTTDRFNDINRWLLTLDTSALGAGASVSAATFSHNGNNKAGAGGTAYTINLFSSTPASNNNLVVGDFDQVGTTAFSTEITYDGWSTVGYNDFVLNASGRANVSLTSISKFSLRFVFDAANAAPTWSSGLRIEIIGYTADRAGTTEDPKLVITYTVATTASFFLMFK